MKLTPCPCCGSSDIYAGVAHSCGYHVRCKNCGIRTRDFNLPDFCAKKNLPQRLTFAAMECWNTRQENKQITASEMGKIGGSRKSPAKTRAARENAKKPRNKKNTQAQARPALPDAECSKQPTNETK